MIHHEPLPDALRPTEQHGSSDVSFARPSFRQATLLVVALIMVAAAAHQVYRRTPAPGAAAAVQQGGATGGVIRLD